MSIIHILNVADLAFMAAGVGVALLMILVSVSDDRRGDEAKDPPPPVRRSARPPV